MTPPSSWWTSSRQCHDQVCSPVLDRLGSPAGEVAAERASGPDEPEERQEELDAEPATSAQATRAKQVRGAVSPREARSMRREIDV